VKALTTCPNVTPIRSARKASCLLPELVAAT
jgi:hypothetical protein